MYSYIYPYTYPSIYHTNSCAILASKGHFHAVHLVADVLAGLQRHHEVGCIQPAWVDGWMDG